MARNREEDEMVGSIPHHGEDPRFADGEGVSVIDNGAFAEIEDFDNFEPVSVDDPPWMPQVVDNDNEFPGSTPYRDADKAFAEATGIDVSSNKDPEMPDDEFAADDELAHRLQQHEEAATDSVGAEVSDIAQMAQVSRMRHAEITVKAKYVRINPESAYRALLGSQRLMSTAYPEPVQVATWSADSDVETTAVTIQFLPVVGSIQHGDFLFNPFKPMRSYGVINFGTRGVYKAEVDIGLGVQLTLNASEVSLQVALENVDAAFGYAKDDAVQLAGMLSFLPCVRTAPITRTRYIDNLPGTAGPGIYVTEVSIPPFARSLIVYRSPNAPAFQLFLTDNSFLSGYVLTYAAGSQMIEPIQLSGDITRVFYQNADPAPVNVKMVFNLGL